MSNDANAHVFNHPIHPTHSIRKWQSNHQQYFTPENVYNLPPPNPISSLPLKANMIRKTIVKSKTYFQSYGWMLLKQYISKRLHRSENYKPMEISFLSNSLKMASQVKSHNYILDHHRHSINQMEKQLRKQLGITQNQSYHDEAISLINDLAEYKRKIQGATYQNLLKILRSDGTIARELICDYASCWGMKHFSNAQERRMAEERLNFMHETVNTIMNMKKN